MFDLKKDPKNLYNLWLCRNNFKKDIVKHIFSLGIHLVYLNKSPIFLEYNRLSKEDCIRLNLNFVTVQNNFFLLKKMIFLFSWINEIFKKQHFNQSNNIDYKIYDNFLNKYDKSMFLKIKKEKLYLHNKIKINFLDVRMKEIFFYIRARNFFETLDIKEKYNWKKHCLKVFNNENLSLYLKNIKEIKKLCSNINQEKNLKKLEDYIINIHAYIMCF